MKNPIEISELDKEGFDLLDRWFEKLDENGESVNSVFLDHRCIQGAYLPYNWRELAFEYLGELGA